MGDWSNGFYRLLTPTSSMFVILFHRPKEMNSGSIMIKASMFLDSTTEKPSFVSLSINKNPTEGSKRRILGNGKSTEVDFSVEFENLKEINFVGISYDEGENPVSLKAIEILKNEI